MYKCISRRVEDINPHRAESLLKLNTFEGQRPMTPTLVKSYAERMADGSFRTGEVAIAKKSFNGGEEVLVNGQKQLQASILSQKGFVALMERWDCPTPDDLWKLFATYDGHQPRTTRHVMKAARGLFTSDALREVPLRILNTCASALTYLRDGTTPMRNGLAISRQEYTSLVQRYESEVLNIAGYATDECVSNLTVPVVVAMIATFRKNHKRATEFWDRVHYGDGLVRHSPQWHVHNIVRDRDKKLGGSQRIAHMFREIITWWNSYISGQPRRSVKVASMKENPQVLG